MMTDRMRRIAVAKAEPERIALRWITKTRELPQQVRMLAMFKLAEMPLNTCLFRLKLCCVVTGRARGVVRDYGVSRHVFREDALAGRIDGVSKSHW